MANKEGVKSSDPVCGNCNKPHSEHMFERETYCFTHTTGDIYTDEPQESWVLDQMADRHPNLYDQIVNEWKLTNGHSQPDLKINNLTTIGILMRPLSKLKEFLKKKKAYIFEALSILAAVTALSFLLITVYSFSPFAAEWLAKIYSFIAFVLFIILMKSMLGNDERDNTGFMGIPFYLFGIICLILTVQSESYFTETVNNRQSIIDRIELTSNGDHLTFIEKSPYKLQGSFVQGDKVEISDVFYKNSDRIKSLKVCMKGECSYGMPI